MAATRQGSSDQELTILPVAPRGQTEEIQTMTSMGENEQNISAPRRGKTRRFATILALFSAVFVSALNSTMITTAIPTIVRELGSADGYAWIGAAYLLGNATAAPIWAKLSDIWGRKPILLTAVALYFFTSIMCALSTSMTMLIAGRALQGVTGGGLVQLVYIVISDLYSMRHRGLYLGLSELIWALAGGIGPVLGGTLAQHASWRWTFWLALPICFFAFMLLLFALDVHNPRTPIRPGLKAIDWAGSASILAMLVLFLLGLNFGGVEYAWSSPIVVCLIVIGLSCSLVFVYSEKKLARYPLMPMSIFQSKSNVASLVVGFAQHFPLAASEFYLPLYFQSVRSTSPTQSGLLILPYTVVTALSGLCSGLIMHRSGRYLELIYTGTALLTLGHGLFISWHVDSGLGVLLGFQAIAGAGVGMLFSPPLIALQVNVPQKDTATATATGGLTRSISTVLAVVIGQTIFQNGMDQRVVGLEMAGVPSNITSLLTGAEAAANLEIVGEIESSTMSFLVKTAFAGALRNVWILNTAIAAAGLLASFFIAKHNLSSEHTEVRTGLEKDPVELEQRSGQ